MQQVENTQNPSLLNLSGKTILITGAAGFIGSNLVEYFATYHKDCNILALDYFRDSNTFPNGNATTLGHFKNLKLYPNVEVLSLDISNEKEMHTLQRQYGKIDYILHEAAVSDTTCMDMRHVMAVNYNAFRALIKLALRHEAHIVYASSAAVYGNTEIPNSVGSNEIPENIYGYSKLCMDKENIRMQKILQDEGIGLIGLRYFNVYGRYEFYKHKTSSMILQLALQALSNRVVRLFEFGEQKRDFVCIHDVVQANVRALELLMLTYGLRDKNKQTQQWHRIHKTFNDINMPQAPQKEEIALQKLFGNDIEGQSKKVMQDWLKNGAVYNVGSGISRSYNDIVTILKETLQISFEVQYIKNPYPFFQNHTLADSANFVPNYIPQYSLESGIKDYVPYIESIYNDIKEGRKTW